MVLPDLPKRGHRVRTAETWAAARADYAAGCSASEVCERHDLGLSALRSRARREGWRRADQADPEPIAFEAEDSAKDDPPVPTEDLVAIARRAAAWAVRRGALHQAHGWLKLYRELCDLASDERAQASEAEWRRRYVESGEQAAFRARIDAIRRSLDRRIAAREGRQVHPVHDPHHAEDDDDVDDWGDDDKEPQPD